MKQKFTTRLYLTLLAVTMATGTVLFASKTQAHHAPVRPENYPSFDWRDPYGWYTNPNRPRRSNGSSGFGSVPGTGTNIYESFVIPDANPMSWEAASRLCDRDGGRLVWRRNRKVCEHRHPNY